MEFYKDRLQKTNSCLLSVRQCRSPDMPQLIELFGFNFDTDLSLLDVNRLFMFLRQWIGRFDLNIVEVENNNLQGLREDTVNFMEFVKDLIFRLDKTGEDVQVLITSLMTNLHNTLIYMDKLSEIAYDKEYVVNKTASQKFHLCLDLYWNILEIFHIITTKYKVSSDITCSHQIIQYTQTDISEHSNSVFYKILRIILWELILHSKNRFNKISLKEALDTPVFTCRCVRNVWSLIISILHHREIYNSEESFWIQIHYVIQTLQNVHQGTEEENMEIDSNVYLYPNGLNVKEDNSDFCLWLLINLAKIEASELRDTNQVKNVKSGNYFDIISVLKQCLNQFNLCGIIGSYGNSSVAKHNTSFQISSSSIDGLATIRKPQDNSFQLYVALLCNHLHRVLDTDSVREWKQMKGRIYSKFHQRRMQELTETGLHNFTCLFICLAITADLEDVIPAHNAGKKLVLWKGMFASVLLYSQRKMDASFITQKLESDFNEVTLKFASSIDSGEHHNQWNLISFYFESLQEVFESSSDLSSSEHKLIGDGISRVINNCRNHELQRTLSTLQVIISKFRTVFDNNSGENSSHRNTTEKILKL
ncbi:hypothetical protein KUTeg_009648 [Tegillarca granosa]|uniref:Protein MMS22-like N-terminal domain-containing protein n=1 Tax=Tegillarca granosa TaxID=220873 RepID=A0ABQ9F4I0_TEGGR|nr:hypothetical protein KUTeg_009648 [Tegillarca granosa]